MACGRVGGHRTTTGARLCPGCTPKAVKQDDHARGILYRVQKELGRLGFQVKEPGLTVNLVPDSDLAKPERSSPGNREGQVNYTIHEDGTYKVQRILVQMGLPPFTSGRIMAHELGHVWLLQEGGRHLDSLKEEGFCELCAWLWMNGRSSHEITYRLRMMERNPDSIYGVGFREAKKQYKSGGIPRLLSWVGVGGSR